MKLENITKCPSCGEVAVKGIGRVYCKKFPVLCTFSREIEKGQLDYADLTFSIFDVETTGLSSDKDDIIQIASRKIVGGETVDKFDIFIKPFTGKIIPFHIQSITKITNEMLVDANDLSTALEKFKNHLMSGDGRMPDYMVAHNANFDKRMLTASIAKAGADMPLPNFIDTLKMARKLIDKELLPNGSYKQEAIAEHYGLSYENEDGENMSHRADMDVYVLEKIFKNLMTQLDSVEEVAEYVIK